MTYRINYEKLFTDRKMIDGVLWAYDCGELHTLSPDYVKRQEEKRCKKLNKRLQDTR